MNRVTTKKEFTISVVQVGTKGSLGKNKGLYLSTDSLRFKEGVPCFTLTNKIENAGTFVDSVEAKKWLKRVKTIFGLNPGKYLFVIEDRTTNNIVATKPVGKYRIARVL